jgi:hypothetical protein
VQKLVPQLVERCAELLGGLDLLAAHVGVQAHTVRFWLHGRATAPNDCVVKMMDLVLQDDIARARGDRRKQLRGADVDQESSLGQSSTAN